MMSKESTDSWSSSASSCTTDLGSTTFSTDSGSTDLNFGWWRDIKDWFSEARSAYKAYVAVVMTELFPESLADMTDEEVLWAVGIVHSTEDMSRLDADARGRLAAEARAYWTEGNYADWREHFQNSLEIEGPLLGDDEGWSDAVEWAEDHNDVDHESAQVEVGGTEVDSGGGWANIRGRRAAASQFNDLVQDMLALKAKWGTKNLNSVPDRMKWEQAAEGNDITIKMSNNEYSAECPLGYICSGGGVRSMSYGLGILDAMAEISAGGDDGRANGLSTHNCIDPTTFDVATGSSGGSWCITTWKYITCRDLHVPGNSHIWKVAYYNNFTTFQARNVADWDGFGKMKLGWVTRPHAMDFWFWRPQLERIMLNFDAEVSAAGAPAAGARRSNPRLLVLTSRRTFFGGGLDGFLFHQKSLNSECAIEPLQIELMCNDDHLMTPDTISVLAVSSYAAGTMRSWFHTKVAGVDRMPTPLNGYASETVVFRDGERKWIKRSKSERYEDTIREIGTYPILRGELLHLPYRDNGTARGTLSGQSGADRDDMGRAKAGEVSEGTGGAMKIATAHFVKGADGQWRQEFVKEAGEINFKNAEHVPWLDKTQDGGLQWPWFDGGCMDNCNLAGMIRDIQDAGKTKLRVIMAFGTCDVFNNTRMYKSEKNKKTNKDGKMGACAHLLKKEVQHGLQPGRAKDRAKYDTYFKWTRVKFGLDTLSPVASTDWLCLFKQSDEGTRGLRTIARDLSRNWVFAFPDCMDGLAGLYDSPTRVYRQTYETIENDWFGVKAGTSVDLTSCYLDGFDHRVEGVYANKSHGVLASDEIGAGFGAQRSDVELLADFLPNYTERYIFPETGKYEKQAADDVNGFDHHNLIEETRNFHDREVQAELQKRCAKLCNHFPNSSTSRQFKPREIEALVTYGRLCVFGCTSAFDRNWGPFRAQAHNVDTETLSLGHAKNNYHGTLWGTQALGENRWGTVGGGALANFTGAGGKHHGGLLDGKVITDGHKLTQLKWVKDENGQFHQVSVIEEADHGGSGGAIKSTAPDTS